MRPIVRPIAYLSTLAEPPLPMLIAATLLGWGALLQHRQGLGHGLGMLENLIAIEGSGSSQISQTLQATLHFNSLILAGGFWLIMLVAMMSPLLADPIRHLWISSLPRRRWIAVVLFLAAYVFIWMLAGAVLILTTILLRILAGDGWLAISVILALAIAWQSSPWKQKCLNRCHWTPRLSPFGLAAGWDCLQYGISNGFWCVGSCWALMLLPLVAVHLHLTLMAIAGVLLAIERYRQARPAQWRAWFLGR
jgi:predicted metal-binding membrane protein